MTTNRQMRYQLVSLYFLLLRFSFTRNRPRLKNIFSNAVFSRTIRTSAKSARARSLTCLPLAFSPQIMPNKMCCGVIGVSTFWNTSRSIVSHPGGIPGWPVTSVGSLLDVGSLLLVDNAILVLDRIGCSVGLHRYCRMMAPYRLSPVWVYRIASVGFLLTVTSAAKTPPKKRSFAVVVNKNNPSTSSSSFASTSNSQERVLVLKEQQDNVVGMIIDGRIMRGGGGGGAILPVDPSLTKALAGAAAFAAIEQVVKRGLQAANLKYPAGLGACILLFTSLCLTDLVAPSLAKTVYEALSPGAAILAKWFPVFFVPGLALLPLSPSMGGTVDVSSTTHRSGRGGCCLLVAWCSGCCFC
jgi:hypothetical protein